MKDAGVTLNIGVGNVVQSVRFGDVCSVSARPGVFVIVSDT